MGMIQHSFLEGKSCNKCGDWKPLTQYHKNRKRPDGHTDSCRECAIAHARAWRADHGEEYNARSRERYRNNPQPINRKNIARARLWREAHLDEYRAIRRKISIRHNHRRRAAEGTYTEVEWATLCAQYDYRCACCGEQKPLTVDHIVPVSRGGSNFIDNIQPLCRSCNSRKAARTIDYRK